MKPEYLKKEEQISFANRILKEVLESGRFGCLSKSDYELVIFDELTKTDPFKSMSNYELANEFKVTETKIKNLMLLSGLRYRKIDSKNCVGAVLRKALENDVLFEMGSEISLPIENPIERREIENALKKVGKTPEYGRNREILKFSPVDLVLLLENYLGGEEDEFLKWCKRNHKNNELIKKISAKGISLPDKLMGFATKGGGELLKILIEAAVTFGFEKSVGH
jgi:hypothetical protein